MQHEPEISPAANAQWTSTERLLTAFAVVLFVSSYLVFGGQDLSYYSTNHRFGDRWYYGGYSWHFVEDSNGQPHTFEREALGVYMNSYRFREPSGASGYLNFHATTERLMASFLVAALSAMSFGMVSAISLFSMLNVALWGAAVLLGYRAAKQLSGKRTAGLVFACLLAVHPVYTLTLSSLKVAALGSVYLLGFIAVYETFRTANASLVRVAAFVLLVFPLGMYCAGGAELALLYLVSRNIFDLSRPAIRQHCMLGAIAFLLSWMLSGVINDYYGFITLTRAYSARSFFGETLSYVLALLGGENTGELRFLGRTGFDFWTDSLPQHLASHVFTNPFVFTFGAYALYRYRELRCLVLPCIALLAAHLAMLMAGWFYVYGYLMLPSLLMMLVGYSTLLGRLLNAPALRSRVLGVALLCGAVAMYSIDALPGIHHQLNLYYGNVGQFPNRHVIALYPD